MFREGLRCDRAKGNVSGLTDRKRMISIQKFDNLIAELNGK